MQVLQACKTTIDVAKYNLSKMDKNTSLLLRLNLVSRARRSEGGRERLARETRLNCIYDIVLVNPFQNS